MNEYETVCVLQPDLPGSRLERVRERIQKILADQKAKLLTQKDWGKRKLAYTVGRFQFGHYLYWNYVSGGALIGELERTLKFEEGILRFLTIKLAEDIDPEKGGIEKKVFLPEEFKLPADEPKFMRDHDRHFDREGGPHRSHPPKGGTHAEEA